MPAPSNAAPVAAAPERTSTQAIVTYVLLAQFNLVGLGVFLLIFFEVTVSDVMLGVLGALIAAVTNAVSLAIGYWLGSSSGSKTANASLAEIASGS